MSKKLILEPGKLNFTINTIYYGLQSLHKNWETRFHIPALIT
jgi:hypothetical protein